MEIAGFGSFDYTQIKTTVKQPTQGEGEAFNAKEGQKEQKPQKTPNELTPAEKQQVAKLQARDAEVRAHEAAHQAAGAGLAGGASFSYQKGPDGKMYAVGGEVPISFKKGRTPEETIANARQVRAAAMAPANPSPQDYKVASSATVMEMKARQELMQQKQKQKEGLATYAQAAYAKEATNSVPPS